MEIVAIANQKGGCGKTTTAINLAAALGKRGKRLLLVDMDPQGHASLGLGQRSEDRPGLYEVFLREVTIGEVIVPDVAMGVDLVPGTISLAAVEHLLADTAEREWRLASHLAQLEGSYDFAVIDCPPSLGLLSFNALRAADRVVVPVELSAFSLDGLERLSETIELLAERYKTDIPVTIVPTMVDQRPRFTRDMLRALRESFDDTVAQSCIHYTVRLKEAALVGLSIFAHDPKGLGSMDYDRLARELMGEQVGRVTVTAFSGKKGKPARAARGAATAVAERPPAKAAKGAKASAAVPADEDDDAGYGGDIPGSGDADLPPWEGDEDQAASPPTARATTRWADAEAEKAAKAAFGDLSAGAIGLEDDGDEAPAEAPLKARTKESGPYARLDDVNQAARTAAASDPMPTLREVVLNFGKVKGRRVQVAGDFNDWIPDRDVATRKNKTGIRKVLKLKPGAYQYRVIVDGVWQEDPGNPERVPNIYGGENSLLHVEPGSEARPA